MKRTCGRTCGRPIGRTAVAVLSTAFVATAWIAAPAPAYAHHAWNEVDTAKTMTLTGVVRSLKWENPHASLVLETDEAGTKTQWTVMMSGVARNESHGVERATVAVGRMLTIVASPARDEPRTVRANRIRSDGKELVLY